MYDITADLANQRAVAKVLERAWNLRLAEFPEFHPVDYYAERSGRLVALVEIKCRARPFADYPVVWCDLHKFWRMTDAARGIHTRALFVVRCHTDIVFCDLAAIDGSTVIVDGRDDRDDPNDHDPIICIPKRHFTVVPNAT